LVIEPNEKKLKNSEHMTQEIGGKSESPLADSVGYVIRGYVN